MTDPFRVFVIGASAGGVETLIRLFKLLPGKLPAAVFVVLHTPATGPGTLPTILERYGKLPAVFPKDGQKIEPGYIYIAPPDYHMKVQKGFIEVWHGPRINLLRPAADVTFSTAAQAYGPLCTGIVLSGTRNDGTAGLMSIKEQGGITIVQDPDEATFSAMPRSAIDTNVVDHILNIDEIADMIQQLAINPIEVPLQPRETASDPVEGDQEGVPQAMEHSKRELSQDRKDFAQNDLFESTRTVLTCPECGGVLVETHNGNNIRYECQIGHGFSESSFIAGHSDMVEYALWAAVRALDERVLLLERMANRSQAQGGEITAERFHESAEEARRDADLIRKIISGGKTIPGAGLLPDDDEEEVIR